ncbi:MAG: KH domain-containing protein [Bacilli bacterium]
MDLVELTSFLVKSIVSDPDMVSVKEFVDDDSEYITIQVLVDNDVIGSVIGRQGTIANAIRTIVQASSYINGLKKVRINIDSF